MTDMPPTMLTQFDIREFERRWPRVVAILTLLFVTALAAGGLIGGVWLIVEALARAI